MEEYLKWFEEEGLFEESATSHGSAIDIKIPFTFELKFNEITMDYVLNQVEIEIKGHDDEIHFNASLPKDQFLHILQNAHTFKSFVQMTKPTILATGKAKDLCRLLGWSMNKLAVYVITTPEMYATINSIYEEMREKYL